MKDKKLITRAILDSLGVGIYIFLVSFVLNNAERIFGSGNPASNKLISPIAFLLFFVFSALLTGGLVLGKPITLYMDGFKKEGIKLLFYTGLFLFIILGVVLTLLILIK